MFLILCLFTVTHIGPFSLSRAVNYNEQQSSLKMALVLPGMCRANILFQVFHATTDLSTWHLDYKGHMFSL